MTLLLSCQNVCSQTRQEMLDSLAAATDSLAYHPDSIDLRLKKAGWNVQLEQWDYAKQEYDYVLGREPDNVAALYFRAFVNTKLGRYDFARLDYQNVLAIVPGNFEAQLGLALLNQKDKHYTQALDGLNALCNAFPDRAEAFAARAGVETERNMLELAEYDFGVALDLDPANIDYRVSRADIRIRLGQREAARDDLDELVRQGVSRPALEDFYRRL
ncbi:MAG: hypothetical protein LUC49_03765 [Prevotella sp.]|nr:hypothetical protein [Prevotella sp.]